MSNYEIIGKGSCSLIISQSLPESNIVETLYSSTDYNISDKTITKLFTEENKTEFYKELKILKLVAEIPDHEHFTVKLISADKCHMKSEYQYQLVMENGGIPINKIRKNIRFQDFIKLMINFYHGLNKLHLKGIVHRDIKPLNVLIDYEKMKLNIIDFGIACRVEDVYKNNDDTNYLLSYMYMFHPPEFYAAALIYDHMGDGHNFKTSLDMAYNVLGTYNNELETFYREHYYRYNAYEVYNIYSYKQAFIDFFDTIREQNFQSMNTIFTDNMAYKSDVYASSFILKSLKKHIIFENLHERQMFNELFDMTYSLNPFLRKNVSDIIDYLCSENICI